MLKFGVFNEATKKLLTYIYAPDDDGALIMAQRAYPNMDISVLEG